MDRNLLVAGFRITLGVALRKESVDRNYAANAVDQILPGSLSARRAWIEIVITAMTSQISVVALRKESVDRNGLGFRYHRDDVPSLSARRAWIEIEAPTGRAGKHAVALRKESVDRNLIISRP